MNWRFNANPAEDGTYVLVRYISWEDEWSLYGDTFYTARGGWNTYYDTNGTFHGAAALKTATWDSYAWTTVAEFNKVLITDIKKALTASKGE